MKFCPTCKQNKPVSEFGKHSKRKDGLQSTCKSCQSGYGKARYQQSKLQYRLRDDALRARNQKAVRVYLESHPCVDCGETDSEVLTFDHVRGKKLGNLSDMVKHSWGLTTIFDEIAKCEVRCANCHLKKTRLSIAALRAQKLSRASLTGLPSQALHTFGSLSA